MNAEQRPKVCIYTGLKPLSSRATELLMADYIGRKCCTSTCEIEKPLVNLSWTPETRH